jgi:hypothetical protein
VVSETLCRLVQVYRRFGTSCCVQHHDISIELCVVHPGHRLDGVRSPETFPTFLKHRRAAGTGVSSYPCCRTGSGSRCHISLCLSFGLLFQLRLPPFSFRSDTRSYIPLCSPFTPIKAGTPVRPVSSSPFLQRFPTNCPLINKTERNQPSSQEENRKTADCSESRG